MDKIVENINNLLIGGNEKKDIKMEIDKPKEITNNDITQNVQLICPTNHYAKTFYHARKSSFILLKQGDYYEPIYLYEDAETQIKVQKVQEVGIGNWCTKGNLKTKN